MATIEEDFVSFETAKLLKGKGFDARCSMIYTADGELLYTDVKHHNMYAVTNKQLYYYTDIIAPSQAVVMKWLREVHNLYIELNWEKGNQLYSFQIWKPEKFQPEISSLDLWRIYKDDNYLGEWIYEQACEAAIKYCLENLI